MNNKPDFIIKNDKTSSIVKKIRYKLRKNAGIVAKVFIKNKRIFKSVDMVLYPVCLEALIIIWVGYLSC